MLKVTIEIYKSLVTLTHACFIRKLPYSFFIYRTTSKRVVFSEDSVLVHVVKLDGIKIRAPVHLLLTGTEMPLQAVGVDGANQVGTLIFLFVQ